MHLRIATPDDARSIARLHAESWRIAYRGQYSDDYLDGPVDQDAYKVWKKRFEQPTDNQYVLLAIEDDALAGFVCAYANDDERWGTLVDNLHVRPRDIATASVAGYFAASAKWSREQYPDAMVHLWVLEGNANARAFYQHLGGEPHDTKVSEPPGGGQTTGIRYVWQGPALDALIAHAIDT